ncbi:histone acetyltransferase 1 [Puccinia graminis f. sp. tritici]|uniref:Histone acetyltransferase type B catalytic subunit n=1 Tax=Puccinia graminis f. sp. tritici TaxID=56615 RepID=A0A5B0M5C4_PUCGR|nr:histone acetyltransferase 1 [Puccinia graminis f. sp. tritici]KAA1123115.1 histone acetyltransferase 1 [Puccinia graminis f. sp. tritici]
MAGEDPERWACDGTGALSLRLARGKVAADQLAPSEQHLISSFHPKFVYPLFGDEETIYGYEDLDIQLAFNSSTLKNYLAINYAAALPEPDPVEKIIYKFIPPDYTKSEATFNADLESSGTKKFIPPGKKISSYRTLPSKGKTKSEHFLTSKRWERCTDDQMEDEQDVIYELWAANWNSPGFREYHRRMQILVLFYIEGGSYIEEDDDRWEFVVLFERRKVKTADDDSSPYSYHFCGYVSLYSFYHYPSSIRLRLSQFIVLPPYQSNGHGSMLYSQIFQYLLTRPEVAELTLEDPSESFEDLRDREDLKLLFDNKVFDEKPLNELVPVPSEWYEKTRTKWKLANRQFARLLEMALRWKFTTLEESDNTKLERLYRIAVKERLYRFNYDSLVDLSKEERREKLQDTFQNVMDDYDRLLRGERRQID